MADLDLPSLRVVVVVDGERTIHVVVPFEHVTHSGEVISLPQEGNPATVRHLISARIHRFARALHVRPARPCDPDERLAITQNGTSRLSAAARGTTTGS